MAKFGTSEDFSRVEATADEGQQQEREEEAKAAQQRLAAAGLELGNSVFVLLASLPGAVVAAERAELARLTALDPGHPRMTQIESTVDALMSAAPVATRVAARAARALDVARSRAQGFHGFVTASDGTPLKDAVVRLGDSPGARAKTADDGYFLIPLSGAAKRTGKPVAAASAHVTITSRTGQTLYEDPVPVPTTAGFAYREYVVEAPESNGRTRKGHDA
jgi:hypothetical protein